MHARALILFSCLAAVSVVTACGRKSDLVTPYEAQIEAQKQAEKDGQPAQPAPEPPANDKRFLLDGLIE